MEIDSERVTPIVQIKEDEEIYSHRWSVDGKTLFYTKGIPKEKTSRIARGRIRNYRVPRMMRTISLFPLMVNF